MRLPSVTQRKRLGIARTRHGARVRGPRRETQLHGADRAVVPLPPHPTSTRFDDGPGLSSPARPTEKSSGGMNMAAAFRHRRPGMLSPVRRDGHTRPDARVASCRGGGAESMHSLPGPMAWGGVPPRPTRRGGGRPRGCPGFCGTRAPTRRETDEEGGNFTNKC